MTQTAASLEQVVHPDGRVELEDQSSVTGSPYADPQLAPTRIEERTWTTYNYTALWMGMAHNIPSYLLASGLIALGMN
jgi:nucleobase:cation symporter-1, NCS1 family